MLGTGDLSELALGWATYGVGDQMSHYNVNASVPKTLIQYLIRWVIQTGQFGDEAGATLQAILDTEISPELVPADPGDDASQPAQSTQEKIGPVRAAGLQHVLRHALRLPAQQGGVPGVDTRGATASAAPGATCCRRRSGTSTTWRRSSAGWRCSCWRFFKTSQFKRSAMPNGPKVGSGGSLSPRGDWRAPSDSEATVWMEELRRNVPDE